MSVWARSSEEAASDFPLVHSSFSLHQTQLRPAPPPLTCCSAQLSAQWAFFSLCYGFSPSCLLVHSSSKPPSSRPPVPRSRFEVLTNPPPSNCPPRPTPPGPSLASAVAFQFRRNLPDLDPPQSTRLAVLSFWRAKSSSLRVASSSPPPPARLSLSRGPCGKEWQEIPHHDGAHVQERFNRNRNTLLRPPACLVVQSGPPGR